MTPLPRTLRGALLGATLVAAAPLPLLLSSAQAQQPPETTVVIVREIDSNHYDPPRTAARSAAEVLLMAADTLVGLDYDMKTPVPLLAKSWTVSEDQLTYTFTLHNHVTFCSGKKLTAHDVVASYQRWLDPNTRGALDRWRAGPVESITAADDLTVVYRLREPYNELLMHMSHFMHSIVNVDQVKELGADFGVKAMDATGPYCFESWTPRNELVLKRHQGYDWGPPIYADTTPKVDRIIWKVVPEENTRLTALQSGQADLSRYLPYWAIDELQADARLSVNKADPFYWTDFFGFKTNKPTVSDARVRRALNLAVDIEALVNGLTFGHATPATSMLATATPAGDNSAYRYDPDAARRLLDEAGWRMGPDGYRYKDGQKLAVLHYGFNSYWKDILEAMQGDMRKVGADLQIQLFDATAAWGKLATQEFDSFTIGFGYMSTSEALTLYFLSTNVPTPNRMNWQDPETDALLAAANRAPSAAEADAIVAKVLAKVSDATVWIPVYHEPLYLVAGPRLKSARAHGILGVGTYKGLDIALQ